MIVRAGVVADAPGIAAVHVHAWQAAYRGILSDELLDGLSIEQRAEQWRRILGDDPELGRCTTVAEQDGEVLGFAHTGPSRDDDADSAAIGELNAIYVRPDAFGTGVGRALMDAALAWFAAGGYSAATLWVVDANARAIRFYERAGWRPDGSRKQETIRAEPVTELRYRAGVSMRSR